MEDLNKKGEPNVNPHADKENEELWLKSNTLDDRINISGAVNREVTDHVHKDDAERDSSDDEIAPGNFSNL